MSAIAIMNRAIKPLPLSCLCHGLILLVVGLWGSNYQPAYSQEPEAAVEFEMTEQELAQAKEIQQVEPEHMSFRWSYRKQLSSAGSFRQSGFAGL